MEELLIKAIGDYFDINKNDTYAYWLTRDKSAYDAGTMTLDDFEEFDENVPVDLARHIMECIDDFSEDINKQEELLEIIASLTSRYR